MKPSNLKSFINNKIKAGKISSELEIYLNEDNLLKNFIARGSVKNLKYKILKNLFLENTNFNFFADNSDFLIKKLLGKIGPIEIKDGDLILKLNPELTIKSNFITNLNLDNESTFIKKNFKNSDFINYINSLKAELNTSFQIDFDKTYKIKNYDFKNNGKIFKAELNVPNGLKEKFYNKKIANVSITDSAIKSGFTNKQKNINISGKYSLNTNDFFKFNTSSEFNNESINLKLNFDYDEDINIELFNYKKPKGNLAEFKIDLSKIKNSFIINKINYKENENVISLKGIEIKNKFFKTRPSFCKDSKKKGKKIMILLFAMERK